MKDFLLKTLSDIESAFDRTSFVIRKKLNRIDPIIIFPYRGYGSSTSLTIRGRVLEDKGLATPSPEDTLWQNFKAMIRRIDSDEIPFIRLQASFQGQTQVVSTDDEGYFEVNFAVDASQLNTEYYWHQIHFELLDTVLENQSKVEAVGEVMIPPAEAEYGIISDVDDTVLITDSTKFIRMMRRTFTENATVRMPFQGITAFYYALQQGKNGYGVNPFFFVSSSPWNIYDLLTDFFTLNHLPKGPLLLRDLGLDDTKFIKEKHNVHKLGNLRKILDTYAHLQFILVGDSGQHDPEIYQQIVTEYPGRILAIYIRDVTLTRRDTEVSKIGEALLPHKVDMVYCEHTEDAARHAAAKGWIKPELLDDIHRDKEKDEALKKDDGE